MYNGGETRKVATNMWVISTEGCFVNLDHVAVVERVPAGWALYSPARLHLGVTAVDVERVLLRPAPAPPRRTAPKPAKTAKR